MRFLLAFCLLLSLPVLAQGHGKHHDFSDVERWIKAFEDPARDEWQKPDMVVELIGLKAGDNVADIGAGTGYFTRRLAKKVAPGGLALAVEIEPGFFPYIDKRALEAKQDNIFTRRAEEDNPRLGVATYDVIFICNTLHHIGHRSEYYAYLKRALRPGGRIVVVDFFKDMEIPVGPKPSERISASDLRTEMGIAGFTVRVDAESLPFQYILTASVRP